MANTTQQFTFLLKNSGFSTTKARIEIFSALRKSQPLTMRELVLLVRGTIDRASVYRTIELFEKLGIVQRLNMGWKYKLELTDNFHDHHHHLICTECGSIIDIPENDEVEDYLRNLAEHQEFHMSTHVLEIHGVCLKCRS